MTKRINILGNGNHAGLYQRGWQAGLYLFVTEAVEYLFHQKKVFATCMVDYKMMKALQEGKFALDQYDWILGTE